jgi:Pyruvate/2-oxoacid:ferredoxin oxidoreductase delta subunit
MAQIHESMTGKNIVLFYFSGTGNAAFITNQIKQRAIEKGLNAVVMNIADAKTVFPEIQPDSIVGFCSPTHGFNMPPIMLRFIRKMKRNRSKNTRAFVLNTRAGMKLYKLFTPGLSGLALILPAIMLRLKGYKIIGYRPIDMPSNWISLHPGIRSKVVTSIAIRCSRITRKFTDKLISGRKVYRGLYSLPIDLALMPIAMAYYFIGRFMLAKTFIASDKCKQCGLCISQCPVQAIQEKRGINYWSFSCESCMKCMNSCPERAIETAHGFTFFIWWLILSVLTTLFTNYLLNTNFVKVNLKILNESLIFNLSSIALSFFTVIIAYKILHFLMHFRFFNRFFTYTSFTKYRFWRRYKFKQNFSSDK